jgi:hypothetical protein
MLFISNMFSELAFIKNPKLFFSNNKRNFIAQAYITHLFRKRCPSLNYKNAQNESRREYVNSKLRSAVHLIFTKTMQIVFEYSI